MTALIIKIMQQVLLFGKPTFIKKEVKVSTPREKPTFCIKKVKTSSDPIPKKQKRYKILVKVATKRKRRDFIKIKRVRRLSP